MIIYLDLDDVVADWHGAAQDFLQMTWHKENERIPQEDWDRIRKNPRFYRDLPIKEGATELVNYCLEFAKTDQSVDVRFLSAIPRFNDMPWAVHDKFWWTHERFPNIPLFIGPYSGDKHKHCQPGDILVDDRPSNCQDWIAAGGKAHIYNNWPACKIWLEETLERYNLSKQTFE